MCRVFVFSMLAMLGFAVLPSSAMALTKAELVDAIANGSKLTKADSGRALDAFMNAATKALKKGDRLSLVGFGSFSVSKRVASANGCDSDVDVDFSPSVSFTAKKEEGGRHTPFHNKIARVIPQSDGSFLVLGQNNGEAINKGDELAIYGRARAAGVKVIAIAIGSAISNDRGGYVIVPTASGPSVVGVVVGGIARKDLEVGGYIESLPPVIEDDPIGACPDDGYTGVNVSDEELFTAMLAETRLPQEYLANAYVTLLGTIIDEVNAGEVVDLGESFGSFVEQSTVSATVADEPCAGLPENCPPTTSYFQLDVAVETGAVTAAELQGLKDTVDGIAKRAARTGRNPQTGKEIKIAAKKVVKFKAGAELATKVN